MAERPAAGSPFVMVASAVRAASIAAVAELQRAELDRDQWEGVAYRVGQGGSRPRQLDRTLQEVWEDELRAQLPFGVRVLGEEIDDDILRAVPNGAYVFDIDPLDGTTNWLALGFGCAMSVVAYRKLRTELLYVGVSVIQPAWRRHWWAEPMTTWRGQIDQPVIADVLVASPWPSTSGADARRTVAGVAASTGKTRDFLDQLTRNGGYRTVTIGGTPLGPEVLDRELDALIECEMTTVFDSAHLMLAANTDAIVGC